MAIPDDFQRKTDDPGIMFEVNGRILFLPEAEQDRFEVKHGEREVARRVFAAAVKQGMTGGSSGPVIQPEASCRWMLHWLLTHDPNNETWRANSVVWMNNC